MMLKDKEAIEHIIKNKTAVAEVLADGIVLRGHAELAREIAGRDVKIFEPGEIFVEEGEVGGTAFFIVAGSIDVLVRNQCVASRGPGEFIGEMALLDIGRKRTASLRAGPGTAVIELPNDEVERLFATDPTVWRGVARQLARRLADRTSLIPHANARPRMFIGSSVEQLPVVDALTSALAHDADVHPWTTVFPASTYTVPALLTEAGRCDFAAFVFAPDDKATIRGETRGHVRDNVVLEAGLFAGVFGDIGRVFVLMPRGANVHILSDLRGLNAVEYQAAMEPNVASAAAHIRARIRDLGVKTLRHV